MKLGVCSGASRGHYNRFSHLIKYSRGRYISYHPKLTQRKLKWNEDRIFSQGTFFPKSFSSSLYIEIRLLPGK